METDRAITFAYENCVSNARFSEEKCETLKARMGTGGNNVPVIVRKSDESVYAIEGNGQRESHHGSGFSEGTMYTLNATEEHGVCYQQPICFTDREGKEGGGKGILCSPIPGALRASGSYYLCDEDRRDVACIGHDERQSFFGKGGKADTLLNNDYKSPQIVAYEETQKQPHRKYIVRRLTPKECCRLQGFPDWWENGVKGSQAERYKMWGNGVGLPNVCDVLFRIKYYLEKEGKNNVSNK